MSKQMRVQIVDPSGDVTPYDHSLAAALARAGVEVELVTSRFLYGPIPLERDYKVTEAFYRRATARGLGSRRARRALKLAEHVPDMLRYRRHAREADVRHYQWLPVEPLDLLLLPPARPRPQPDRSRCQPWVLAAMCSRPARAEPRGAARPRRPGAARRLGCSCSARPERPGQA